MSVLASIIPGMTVAPPASTGFTPDGTDTFAPTASIRLPVMTMVPLGITGPETVTIRALVIAQVGPAALPLTSNFSAGAAPRAAGAACAPLVATGDGSVVAGRPAFSF